MSVLFGIPFPASTVILFMLDTWRLVLSPSISPSFSFRSTMAHCYAFTQSICFLRCTILAFIHIFIINHTEDGHVPVRVAAYQLMNFLAFQVSFIYSIGNYQSHRSHLGVLLRKQMFYVDSCPNQSICNRRLRWQLKTPFLILRRRVSI